MATETVARGDIVIELDDRATRELEAIERQFDRTTNKIDRTSAEVELKADVDRLKRDLKEAEAAVKDYSKKIKAEENGQVRGGLMSQKRLREAEAQRAREAVQAAEKRMRALKGENQ